MATRSLAAAKTHFSAIVESVRTTHERVVVTKNGEPAVVIISPSDLEALEETVAVLSDADTMAALRAGEDAAASGDFMTEAEVRAGLGGRRMTG